ncbi:MAG: uracil-DNA glycosylase family protein [Hyphomonadaceae bacterium]|nr:uracil-DNA glycosylase family protein [Hyphomonadaceae bacterium]
MTSSLADADLQTYAARIRACRLCAEDMPNRPNPILQVHREARILVVGQAPGNLADTTGKPFNDPSGVRLRAWMGVSDEEFYDPTRIALAPMGFCFPGYDRNGGDIPPMKRCAKEWRAGLLARLPNIKVTLLVGSYAQKWHLGARAKKSLRETVAHWQDYAAEHIFTTPHPSWRNNGWLKANPWFESEVLPALQASVRSCL